MAKTQLIDPTKVRKPSFIEFDPIPVNQYQKTVKEERKNYTDEELMTI